MHLLPQMEGPSMPPNGEKFQPVMLPSQGAGKTWALVSGLSVGITTKAVSREWGKLGVLW